MKKTITTLLTLTMAASLAGCGSKPADEPTKSPETVIESAVDFYTEVWDALGEDRQFAAVGGDAEHEAEAPAKFAMTDENKETFEYLLHVNDELTICWMMMQLPCSICGTLSSADRRSHRPLFGYCRTVEGAYSYYG